MGYEKPENHTSLFTNGVDSSGSRQRMPLGRCTLNCLQESRHSPFQSITAMRKTALDSVYSLFGITRGVIKEQVPDCINFTRVAIVVLNQVIRPFTAKWHRKSLAGDFERESERVIFREELAALQVELRKYSRMLADIAEVEDLTDLEESE